MSKIKFIGPYKAPSDPQSAFDKASTQADSKQKTNQTDPHKLLGKALIQMMRRNHGEGLDLVDAALANIEAYSNQAPIYSKAIRVCLRGKLYEKAEKILQTAKEKFPDEVGFSIEEAQIRISQGKPKDAVALLHPLRTKNPKNIVVATALAASYFHDGNPRETIKHLTPFKELGLLDGPAAIVLGHAYLFLNDFKNYGGVIGFIKDPVSETYLTAASYYLQNNSAAALKALLNIQTPKDAKTPKYVVSLTLACIGTEHPIHLAIKERFGEDFYNKRLQESKDWQDSPERSIQRNYSMASSKGLFELGGNPVSGQANRAASISAPVHVRRALG